MRSNRKPLLAASVAALAVSAFGQLALADDETSASEAAAADQATDQAAAGVSGNFHFTDEQGRARNPSPEELIATSEGLQADLERITGKKPGKVEAQTHANGMVSANIAPSKLVFLTVQENEDGTLSYRHAELDEDGELSAQPDNSLPEM